MVVWCGVICFVLRAPAEAGSEGAMANLLGSKVEAIMGALGQLNEVR